MPVTIEHARLRELMKAAGAPVPTSPRDAVQRYFGFNRLDAIERLDDEERKEKTALADKMRKDLYITLDFEKKIREFAVTIRDHGMGQAPAANLSGKRGSARISRPDAIVKGCSGLRPAKSPGFQAGAIAAISRYRGHYEQISTGCKAPLKGPMKYFCPFLHDATHATAAALHFLAAPA